MVEVVMYLSEKLVKFLEDNKILVKRLNFKQIYENISKDLDNVDINDIGVMTYVFYKSGLDPLKYLDNIPSYFLYNVDATDLNISDFKIPTNIKLIYNNVFENCRGITNIEIPDSVTACGQYAFNRCTDLTNIYLPGSLMIIDSNACANCKKLEHVTIYSGIGYIGNYVFANCDKLLSIDFKGTKSEWRKIRKLKKWNFDSKITCIHCTDGDIDIR